MTNAVTGNVNVKVGDVVRYQIGGEWVSAKVLNIFASDSLTKQLVATIQFWYQGRRETIDCWLYSLRVAGVRPSVVIPVENGRTK